MGDDASKPTSRLRRGLSLAGRVGRRLVAGGQRDKPVPTEPVPVRFVSQQGDPVGSGPVEGGISVLAAAMRLDVRISHYCGGMCSCGTCRIEVVEGAENLSYARGNEQMVLGAERAAGGDRLACQARVLGPVVVRVPRFF